MRIMVANWLTTRIKMSPIQLVGGWFTSIAIGVGIGLRTDPLVGVVVSIVWACGFAVGVTAIDRAFAIKRNRADMSINIAGQGGSGCSRKES